jgi:hypothetical protein
MNYTFKNRTYYTFNNFNKSFFKNKNIFNMFSSITNTNKKFQINFSNKCYMTKIYAILNNKQFLSSSSLSLFSQGPKSSSFLDQEDSKSLDSAICEAVVSMNQMIASKYGNLLLIKKENLVSTLHQLSVASTVSEWQTRLCENK